MRISGATDSNKETLKRRTVQRVSVAVRAKVSAVGGAPVMPQLKAVIVTATLKRAGKEHVLFNSNLFVLCRESMFLHAMESFQTAGNGMTMGNDYWLYPGMIDLGSPIHLQGDDEIVFEASATPGWVPAGLDPNNTSIDFRWRAAYGVEEAIPQIVARPIQANIAQFQDSLGDNITSIGFINLAVSATLNDANAVFTKIVINSDRYDVSDELDHMIARRYSQFETSGVAHSRALSFLYLPGGEIDKVNVDILLNAANVANSDNFIVYRKFTEDYHTLVRAEATREKHQRRNTEKLYRQVPELAR